MEPATRRAYGGAVLIRRETPADADAIRAVHSAAFAKADGGDGVPVEATLVDALRADEGWLPAYSLVATDSDGQVVGHVVATRGRVGGAPVASGWGRWACCPTGSDAGWAAR